MAFCWMERPLLVGLGQAGDESKDRLAAIPEATICHQCKVGTEEELQAVLEPEIGQPRGPSRHQDS